MKKVVFSQNNNTLFTDYSSSVLYYAFFMYYVLCIGYNQTNF